ncbi:MAG TPA: ADOP family duplicated permease [Vicinamibacterales bacterium]|nr:ADOP family duplicated permease [Vicinamibacterales bacterium]
MRRVIIALTLALGTAALTTAFAVVDGAIIRQPPFPQPERLAMLNLQRNPPGEPSRRERWSFTRFELLRSRQTSFDDVASFSPASVTLSTESDSAIVYIERVSSRYLTLLGAIATPGRLFDDADDDPARPLAVAIIGHDVWRARFASNASIVGRTIRLNGVPLTVVGVLQPGFTGLSGRAGVWVPRTISPRIAYAEYLTTNQNFIPVVGRLKRGVTLDAARSELAVLGSDINRELPSDPRFPDERVTGTAMSLNEARVDPTIKRSVLVLLGAVALLHLLACTNVINLLLGRATTRRREYALRLALGSSSRQLFLHILTGGAALAAIGAGGGVLLGWWATSVLTPPASQWATFFGVVAPFDTPAFSIRVWLFGAAVVAITAALTGVLPALAAFRLDVSRGLSLGSRSVTSSALSLRKPTLHGAIVGFEAVLAAILVVTSGLLLDSVQRMRRADVGVDPDRILTFWVIPSEARVPTVEAPRFVARLIEAVARVPGIESVSVDGGAPLSGSASSTLYILGRPAPPMGQAPPVTRHYVGPDHFQTLGIPLRRGRVLSATDTAGTPRVTVISESAARRFFPNEEPIGRRVWFGGGSDFDSPDRAAEIVGIVGDVRYQPFDRPANLASFYTPFSQFTYGSRMVFARTAGDPLSVVPDVRRAVAGVDPELAAQDVRALSDLISGSWARRRFDAALLSGFGLAAVLLAASGVFAVLAYSVEARRREFGIRIALGARRSRVIWHVLREGMGIPIAGLAVGIAGATALTRVLQSALFETSPHEPRVLAAMAAVLLLASLAACLGPAWRATRADPIAALRSE